MISKNVGKKCSNRSNRKCWKRVLKIFKKNVEKNFQIAQKNGQTAKKMFKQPLERKCLNLGENVQNAVRNAGKSVQIAKKDVLKKCLVPKKKVFELPKDMQEENVQIVKKSSNCQKMFKQPLERKCLKP